MPELARCRVYRKGNHEKENCMEFNKGLGGIVYGNSEKIELKSKGEFQIKAESVL